MRVLSLLMHGELSVKDIAAILGQSQPRVSRHLKLLADARLVTRNAEGAWAYYRLADNGVAGALLDWIGGNLDRNAPDLIGDLRKLEAVRKEQQDAANAYFSGIAGSWDRLRSLHAPDAAVEAAILDAVPGGVDTVLDLGTGTGRMLELLADRYRQGVGVDTSREMLAVARAKLDAAEILHAQVRQGDITDLEDYGDSADVVVMHQVLHYFDDPALPLANAARCLRGDGRLLVIDFAPHQLEFLRDEQAHRRLGLSNEQMAHWAAGAGLAVEAVETVPPTGKEGLTVCLWTLASDKNQTLKGTRT